MAHVFLALGQIDQAHPVATSTAVALEPKVTSDARPEVLSLYGASHLILAVAAARDNKRSEAHDHLDTARKIAEQHPGSSTTVDGTHAERREAWQRVRGAGRPQNAPLLCLNCGHGGT
jgi:hypothetical protein